MKRIFKLVLLVAASMMPLCAYGNSVSLIIDSPRSVLQGSAVTFSGTLSISGTDTNSTYINSDDQNLSGTNFFYAIVGDDILTFDDTDFLFNILLLDPFFRLNVDPAANDPDAVTSATVDLFTISAGSLVTAGPYEGIFRIYGGPDANSFEKVAEANFSVEVVAPEATVPEPSTFVLLVAALIGFGPRLGLGKFARKDHRLRNLSH